MNRPPKNPDGDAGESTFSFFAPVSPIFVGDGRPTVPGNPVLTVDVSIRRGPASDRTSGVEPEEFLSREVEDESLSLSLLELPVKPPNSDDFFLSVLPVPKGGDGGRLDDVREVDDSNDGADRIGTAARSVGESVVDVVALVVGGERRGNEGDRTGKHAAEVSVFMAEGSGRSGSCRPPMPPRSEASDDVGVNKGEFSMSLMCAANPTRSE